MKRITQIAAWLLAACCSGIATAETVYRCGNFYSQKPCPGGVAVDAGDARTPVQATQATHSAQRDAQAARALEKDRLAQESRAAPPVIVSNAPRNGASAPAAPSVIRGKPPKAKAGSASGRKATAATSSASAAGGKSAKKPKPPKKPRPSGSSPG